MLQVLGTDFISKCLTILFISDVTQFLLNIEPSGECLFLWWLTGHPSLRPSDSLFSSIDVFKEPTIFVVLN